MHGVSAVMLGFSGLCFFPVRAEQLRRIIVAAIKVRIAPGPSIVKKFFMC
jgi:hypothetical protein